MESLHLKSLKHGDFKFDNVFVKGGKAAIGDLEQVHSFDVFRMNQGTLLFMAPEIIMGRREVAKELEGAQDIWSYGNSLLAALTDTLGILENPDDPSIQGLSMVLNLYPREAKDTDEVFVARAKKNIGNRLARIFELHADRLTYLDPDGVMQSIIRGCLQFDPRARISAAEIVRRLEKK